MTQTIEEKAIELCERLSCHVILEDDEERIQDQWDNDPRWNGIQRPYTPEDVLKLRGTLKVEYSFAEAGAKRLWHLLQTEDYIAALGALTGNMAVQQVEAGLQAAILVPEVARAQDGAGLVLDLKHRQATESHRLTRIIQQVAPL